MEQDVKVFSSQITRGICGERNNLYELLNIEPAKPVKLNEVPKSCAFQSKSDKYYEYKKKSKLKVKTVKYIRNLFEKDIDEYLPQTLEKQQNALLKRIRNGCSKDEDTKQFAINILKSDNPILRTSWQMLTNINPENHIHFTQYVLWNGNNIRVCGSRGGSNKFIFKFIRHINKEQMKNKKNSRKAIVHKKKSLLQHSLSLKIKPGPLRQKKYIDDSYQKHHVGNLNLVNLPKPGLDVMPVYGSPMELTIRNFLHSLRDVDGMISNKWAEFAVSTVGTLNQSNVIQFEPNTCTTFDLNYKYDQKKMLMRRDIETFIEKTNDSIKTCPVYIENNVLEEVGKVVRQIIDSVEISLNQDRMFNGEDDCRNMNDETGLNINSNNSNAKDKNKKKFGELDRLDVTVIRLPENTDNTENKMKNCSYAYCALGCICDSLNCAVIVKEHCGRLDCMFQCKCDFSSYKDIDNYDSVSSDLIPGLLKLDKEMNSKLSKEEQKFHQTVVLSGDKSIILKSRKRSWKTSTKYSEFYKTMPLKNNKNVDRDLIVVLTKINCDNIEPWCMVHNLYKCFCKGRFVHNIGETEVKHFEAPVSTVTECEKIINSASSVKCNMSYMQTRPQREKHLHKPEKNEKRKYDTLVTKLDSECEKIIELESNVKSYTRTFQRQEKSNNKSEKYEKRQSDNLLSESYSIPIDLEDPMHHYRSTCARLQAYAGRKYTSRYYRQMNFKIKAMEKDDQSLHKRLKSLVNIDQVSSKNIVARPERMDIASRKDNYSNENHGNHKLDEDVIIAHKVMKKTVPSTVSRNMEETTTKDTPEINVDNIRENILSDGLTTNDIDESSKSKLVAWLEHSYKQYKKRCDLGQTKLTLQAPQPKKMTLLPWNFILERYKERKNLFLVTKQKPFRMFMAVNRDHPFLQDCINIDDIRFADLYIYPVTVKKLITNATDLKDSFCILCGHAYCWELIGSVTKVDDPTNKNTLTCDESICLTNDKSMEYTYNENSHSESDPPISSDEDTNDTKKSEMETNILGENQSTTESSKWFVMTIENDFSEIQFYNRGFFVKYVSIIKAINIARCSKKTVRLSSQKCAENSTNSQFGVYAIPNANEDCVFIGPYECHESLGIETIRSMTYTRKRTRGYWITTNKIDNMSVIDNPMSFMLTKEIKPNEILALKSKPNEKKDSFSCIEEEESNESDNQSSSKEKPKLVKPIKISKSSFYPISTNSLIRLPIHLQKNQKSIQPTGNTKQRTVSVTDMLSNLIAQTRENTERPITDTQEDDNMKVKTKDHCAPGNMFTILKPEISNPFSLSDFLLKLNENSNEIDGPPPASDQQESIQSQFDSDCKDDVNATVRTKADSKPEGSVFAILKPEEINKRIMNTTIKPNESPNEEEYVENLTNIDSDVERDIEHFIDNPLSTGHDINHHVFVISDDDEECADNESSKEDVTSVWIECKNIKNFGWISGLRNNKNKLLSFQFPGFNFSPYYPEGLALKKIISILSRKILMPTKMEIEWNIVTQKSKLKAPKKLRTSDLGAHLVLTKYGPILKRDLMMIKKTSTKSTSSETASVDTEIEAE
ncbi:uncharacterized protein ocm [Plodia interpunctella]|uniref:uncharacterized protein ocm n=1 Tax=Plodia interpunctella TaxID=58824 RepID=UPI0023687AE8|nr:uncharacterized protein LOC128669265 [Plodia interpunctella]XP_053599963.1 uncharacterized protein LOC128669265 [Plodia interpunctella]XP_053599964.1 uncharacterized protein LOC128669265 [Plodia interpunctella]XP_053599965.1 uncharacterized protein LOC128669265 [Plodia interpunctella]